MELSDTRERATKSALGPRNPLERATRQRASRRDNMNKDREASTEVGGDKADNYYAPECDGNIRWDGPDIAVAWPIAPTILSAKDEQAPTLKERAAESLNFVYEG